MRKIILGAFLSFAAFSIQAQESIVSSGGDATDSSGSISYSVGQLFTNNFSTGVGSVSEGVQSVKLDLTTLSNAELTTVNLRMVVYPNPTTDYVVLSVRDSSLSNLSYALYNVYGKTMDSGVVSNDTTEIALKNVPIGVYILKVSQNNKELKTFKIIKK